MHCRIDLMRKHGFTLDPDSPPARLLRLVEDAPASVILGCTDLRVAFSPDEILPPKVAAERIVHIHCRNS